MGLALYVIVLMRCLCRATPDIVAQDRLDPKIASVIVESQAPSSLHVAVGFYASLGFQARFILAGFAMAFQAYASKWGWREERQKSLD